MALTTAKQSPPSEQQPNLTQRVLLIEDDREIVEYVSDKLGAVGYAVQVAQSCESAKEKLETGTFDVMLLDRMLPDGDGLAFLAGLRARDQALPTIVISALGDISQRIRGLNDGADDYIAKPFDCDELVARIDALIRRSADRGDHQIRLGDLHIDLEKRQVVRSGSEIRLQPREFDLLAYFAKQPNTVITRSMLLKNVWGFDFDPQTNVVDVHVSRLRAKLDRNYSSKLLHTVRGKGYRLSV